MLLTLLQSIRLCGLEGAVVSVVDAKGKSNLEPVQPPVHLASHLLNGNLLDNSSLLFLSFATWLLDIEDFKSSKKARCARLRQ